MVVGCRAQDDDTGRAYVFVRQDGVWTQQAELIPNFPNSGDTFGTSVAISGDTILVGSPGEQSSSTGVNGPEGNNSAPSSGAAYIFLRTGVTWTQQAYLKASNTGAGDNFGAAVALKNNLAIIGAPGEDSATSAVNGDGSNNAAENSGAAYIYSRHAGVWSQQAYLKASNAESGDSFGGAVALDEKEVAVGASSESSGAKGVNGDQQNNASLNSGAVYLFATENAMWTQKAYVKASNTDENDGFGTSVSLSGQVLAVGAPYEASSSTIINGDQLNNSLPAQGAVYLFRKTAEEWQQETYLKPHSVQGSDTGEIPYGAEFGASVCISGNQILVGAPQERSDSSGLNSSFPNNGAPASGAAYLFVNEDERWALAHFLKASNTESGDNFGWAAAIDGDLSTIGAWSESSGATGINGDQNSNSSAAAGAVYIFASQH